MFIAMLANLHKLYPSLNLLFKGFLKRLHKVCQTNSFPKTFSKHLPVFFKTFFNTNFPSQHIFITKADLKVFGHYNRLKPNHIYFQRAAITDDLLVALQQALVVYSFSKLNENNSADLDRIQIDVYFKVKLFNLFTEGYTCRESQKKKTSIVNDFQNKVCFQLLCLLI